VELSTAMAIYISNKITNFIKIRSFILKRSWFVDFNAQPIIDDLSTAPLLEG
jgi:hypothetical protein